MNRPEPRIRFIGSPAGAGLAFAGSGLIVVGCARGALPWWLIFVAVAIAAQTKAAIAEVRRYEAWRKEWQAMGASTAPPRAVKKHGRRWVPVTVAALLLVAIPAYLPRLQDYGGPVTVFECVWGAVALYLGFRIRQAVTRRTKNGGSGKAEAAPVVAWLLGRASSSPSRADAMRELPEYSARLMGQGYATLPLAAKILGSPRKREDA